MAHSERSVWDLVESVTILFMRGYLAARSRAFEHPMPMVRLLAQRDHAHTESVLLERELAIYRSQRHCKSPKLRPHYSPQERSEILQLMCLRGWSCKEAAARFVVHPNTIRNWKLALRDKLKTDELIGAPPWNKLHEGVRWLVHEIRQLCPERDFGTQPSLATSCGPGSRSVVHRFEEFLRSNLAIHPQQLDNSKIQEAELHQTIFKVQPMLIMSGTWT